MARMIKQTLLPLESTGEYPDISEEPYEIFSGTIYQLGIHALPGTQFKINNSDESIITIGPTGNFSLNCEELPLTSIALKNRPLTTITYPTIIDIVYEGGNQQ